MNYYEQFDLTPAATSEQIHKAYRSLCRLLHPDQQQSEDLRALAEAQMRWVNEAYETLRDPERRQAYDNTLHQCVVQHKRRRVPLQHLKRRTVPRYGLAIVAVSAIAWYVSGEPVRKPTISPYAPSGGSVFQERVSQPAAPPVRASRSEPLRPRLTLRPRNPAHLLPPAHADLFREAPPPIPFSTDVTSAQNLPAMPTLPKSIENPHSARSRFTGTWYYARAPADAAPEPGTRSMYPPEYIEAVINERGEGVEGRYRARYLVTDRAISPTVAFQFAGTIRDGVASLRWRGRDGSEGDAQLRLLSESSMELKWSATSLGGELTLVAGRAVLIRRQEPAP